jgi:hypothetical protein
VQVVAHQAGPPVLVLAQVQQQVLQLVALQLQQSQLLRP